MGIIVYNYVLKPIYIKLTVTKGAMSMKQMTKC